MKFRNAYMLGITFVPLILTIWDVYLIIIKFFKERKFVGLNLTIGFNLN